ncbi:hypothetical protein [Yinghuangia soli]|uniref:Uncharacterized protein n=1 Tax=Yinghuangia soli TaxID=2908204 RepID=A0AA41U0Q3_9ACTN|nr:hypothetical protein [Yinghuangia soli]MCF2526652.1 hypothetical protein [Yinghuangia soli]
MADDLRHDDPADAGFAASLPGELRAASAAFPGPSADLAARGHARGLQMRRTRRIRMGVSAAALACVAGLGFTYATGAFERGASELPAGPATPTPTLDGAAPAARVTAAEVLAVLKSLLPSGGSFTEEHSAGTGEWVDIGPQVLPGPFASVMYNDGMGRRSEVRLAVTAGGKVSGECPSAALAPDSRCTPTLLENGDKLVGISGHTHPDRPDGQKQWTARLVRPDGVAVSVDAFGGGAADKTASAADPVVSVAELTALVRSPRWAPAAAAAKAYPQTREGEPSRDVSADAIIRQFKSIIPGGVTVTEESGQGGYATLIADDGKGRSLVTITVQRDMAEALDGYMNCGRPDLAMASCTAATLPDRSRLLLVRRPSDDGQATVWQAELLTADGLRVIVSTDNAGRMPSPIRRNGPIYTLEQLQAIVTDTRWTKI